MPKCTCIITCQGAALDQSTQNWTLFGTIEEVTTPFLGVPHPFETVTFWHIPDAELNRKFQVRLVVETEDGERAAATEALEFVTAAVRHRLRIVGFPFPKAPGKYVAKIEWRFNATDPWTKEAPEWRIEIKSAAMPVEATPAEATQNK